MFTVYYPDKNDPKTSKEATIDLTTISTNQQFFAKLEALTGIEIDDLCVFMNKGTNDFFQIFRPQEGFTEENDKEFVYQMSRSSYRKLYIEKKSGLEPKRLWSSYDLPIPAQRFQCGPG